MENSQGATPPRNPQSDPADTQEGPYTPIGDNGSSPIPINAPSFGRTKRASLNPKYAENTEDAFRIPWKDTRGHSEKDWLRIQPLIMNGIEEVVQSKKFPFKSRGDFYRVAINDLLNKLAGLGWESSILGQAQLIQRMTVEEGYAREFFETMQGVEDEVVRLRGRGYIAEADAYLERVRREVEGMPLGLWRGRYVERLDQIEKGAFRPQRTGDRE